MDDAVKRFRQIFGCKQDIIQERLCSSICRPTDLEWLPRWAILGKDCNETEWHATPHRKMWEWLFIYHALSERKMLMSSRKGLGFGVGKEPLSSVFTSLGCSITATDAPPDMSTGWEETNQYGKHINDLFNSHFVEYNRFFSNVRFEYVDMRHIPPHLNEYDFLWSSCALEHLGSLYAAKEFIYRAMDCLKPEGIAVHTTEINLSSSSETLVSSNDSILRTVDFIEIAEHLVRQGHCVEPLDFRLDGSALDELVDEPPYSLPHFKLEVGGYVSTSFCLIIRKRTGDNK
ncbi:MAG: class I SAM-dependent methyltransferase [Oscillospiraceae bacterium]|nr:class I SAM-dependent methyltransferase [Oscillospiraceae bacterium]